ncbi:MAG: GIN domain-containing protein [Caulobacteraceae bacterium]
MCKGVSFGLVSVLVASAAGGALAQPSVKIRNAVARVVVVPEARADVEAVLVKTNPRFPIRIRQQGGAIIIDGDIGHRPHVCHSSLMSEPSVGVWGRGDVHYRDMPEIVIHTPMDVHISAGEAVFGSIGRSDSLDFSNRGCGDWTIANVKGLMRIAEAGSGDARTGSAGSADISVAGSGDIAVQTIRSGLTAVSTGSGDVTAGAVFGPLNIRIAGSGDVKARSGSVNEMTARIAGSGDVVFGGIVDNLEASIAGSGDVTVAKATGRVSRSIFGSGDVNVGR